MALELVVATANPAKVAEIAAVFGDAVVLRPRPSSVGEVVEDAADLEGNARFKAQAICSATGLPAVADDTGLEVDALGGAPGVHSARYAGDDAVAENNVAKLLGELASVAAEARTARFRTAAMVVYPDGHELLAHGVAEGHIVDGRRGDGGFGYDPVFVPTDGDGRTFAEMDDNEKNTISHRGRAFRSLLILLEGHGDGFSLRHVAPRPKRRT